MSRLTDCLGATFHNEGPPHPHPHEEETTGGGTGGADFTITIPSTTRRIESGPWAGSSAADLSGYRRDGLLSQLEYVALLAELGLGPAAIAAEITQNAPGVEEPSTPSAEGYTRLLTADPTNQDVRAKALNAWIADGYTPAEAEQIVAGALVPDLETVTDSSLDDIADLLVTVPGAADALGMSEIARNQDGTINETHAQAVFEAFVKRQAEARGNELEPAELFLQTQKMLSAYKEAVKGEDAPKSREQLQAEAAAKHDALIAETNNAMAAYEQAIGSKIYRTDVDKGFYYDADGDLVPVAYSSQRGRVEAGAPQIQNTYVTGSGGFATIVNAPRARQIEDQIRASGQYQISAQRAAEIAQMSAPEQARAIMTDLGLDHVPSQAEVNAYLGTSSSGGGDSRSRFFDTVEAEMPSRTAGSIQNTSNRSEAEARFSAMAARAYPDDPQAQQRYIDVNLAARDLYQEGEGTPLTDAEEAFFATIDPSQYRQAPGTRTGQGDINGFGTSSAPDSPTGFTKTVFGGGEESGVGRVREMTAIELQNELSALNDSGSASRIFDDLERNFSMARGSEGFFITGPDGTQHGPFDTVQDAEDWRRFLARQLYQAQQRDLDQRFGGNKFGGDPNAGLGSNPSRLRVGEPDVERPRFVPPPPVDTTPPQVEPPPPTFTPRPEPAPPRDPIHRIGGLLPDRTQELLTELTA